MRLLSQSINIDGQTIEGPLSGNNPITGQKLETVGDIVNLALAVIFPLALVALFIYLVWGGVDMARNLGNPELIKKGKERITNAIIGIIVLSVSYWGAQILRDIFF